VGLEATPGIHRRRARLDRRQSIHLSRDKKNPRHGLETRTHDRTRHRPDARLAAAEPVGLRETEVKLEISSRLQGPNASAEVVGSLNTEPGICLDRCPLSFEAGAVNSP